MRIIKLTAEHVKRLRAVEITPQGNVVVISGKNGQGKSSVLDSIVYALGGDPADSMPVHRGETKAKTVVDLGDLVVQRTITAEGGGQLVVKDKDGVRQTSPQQILDRLVGKLTFDPLDFARQKPAKQAEILRGIVGLDFTEHDKKREAKFEQRTILNREAKQYQARMTTMREHADAPAAEQSVADILRRQREASETNAANDKIRRESVAKRAAANTARQAAETTQKRIDELKAELARQLEAAKGLDAAAARAEAEADKLRDQDLAPFQKELVDVELGNLKFRENAQRAEVVRQYKAKTDLADQLTSELEAMDAEKRRKTMDAKYPIEGLQFDSVGGVMFNNIPFAQASTAEQIRVSVAIGLALNPKLRVLLIRDGSLLDDDSMKVIAEMAKAADAQIWMERVETDAATSVVIEDGAVAEAK